MSDPIRKMSEPLYCPYCYGETVIRHDISYCGGDCGECVEGAELRFDQLPEAEQKEIKEAQDAN